MHVLYIDESGDHDLINIDKNYPIFVLGGSIVNSQYHDDALTPMLNKFKQNIFGKKEIVLHYADYTRNKNGFERMVAKEFRENFYEGLNKIIKDTKFTFISCIIDKPAHSECYKYPRNPYVFSLEVIIEKFILFLNEINEQGVIIAESRNSQLDNELNLAFLNLKISGTRFLKSSEITKRIGNNFYIKNKEENIAGLQLTDSIVTSIGRRYLGLKNPYISYNAIKEKFRKHSCGKYKGYGLVILPKKSG